MKALLINSELKSSVDGLGETAELVKAPVTWVLSLGPTVALCGMHTLALKHTHVNNK